MKLRDLLAGIPHAGEWYDEEMEINSISDDSRLVESGGLFVAVRGMKSDGHDHIHHALERGAAVVLCERQPDTPGVYIVVEDARQAYARLCANWFGRPGEGMTLVAVTGTNGKTTTTSLLHEVISGVTGKKVGLIGTNRNLIGEMEVPAEATTPDSYSLQQLLRRMADAGCSYVVMEASSHALSQCRTGGLTFDVGVFTNLSRDHLDYHRDMECYRKAKGRLFDQCRMAVLNLDDEAGRRYREEISCPMFTYSENDPGADISARDLRLFPGHVDFVALRQGALERIHLPIPGGFSVYNALAVLAAGSCLGLELGEMARVMRTVKGVKGRVEIVPVPRAFTVIIDYAHSPNALENILMTARDVTAGRLICLFGCGGDRDKTKRPIMGTVAQELADLVVVTTDNPRTEAPGDIIADILAGMSPGEDVVVLEDRAQAIRFCLELGRPGDVIVLAGKGHETTQEVNGVKYPMDERKIVAEYFENLSKARGLGGRNLPAVSV